MATDKPIELNPGSGGAKVRALVTANGEQQVISEADGTTGVLAAVTAAGARLVAPTSGTYGGQAGAAGTVNVPSGAVVRSFAASASGAATVTVPGITGNVILTGSAGILASFGDDPDPGTMVGPCTFVFTGTSSFTVVWVL